MSISTIAVNTMFKNNPFIPLILNEFSSINPYSAPFLESSTFLSPPLPVELWQCILKFLDLSEITEIISVNKFFYFLSLSRVNGLIQEMDKISSPLLNKRKLEILTQKTERITVKIRNSQKKAEPYRLSNFFIGKILYIGFVNDLYKVLSRVPQEFLKTNKINLISFYLSLKNHIDQLTTKLDEDLKEERFNSLISSELLPKLDLFNFTIFLSAIDLKIINTFPWLTYAFNVLIQKLTIEDKSYQKIESFLLSKVLKIHFRDSVNHFLISYLLNSEKQSNEADKTKKEQAKKMFKEAFSLLTNEQKVIYELHFYHSLKKASQELTSKPLKEKNSFLSEMILYFSTFPFPLPRIPIDSSTCSFIDKAITATFDIEDQEIRIDTLKTIKDNFMNYLKKTYNTNATDYLENSFSLLKILNYLVVNPFISLNDYQIKKQTPLFYSWV